MSPLQYIVYFLESKVRLEERELTRDEWLDGKEKPLSVIYHRSVFERNLTPVERNRWHDFFGASTKWSDPEYDELLEKKWGDKLEMVVEANISTSDLVYTLFKGFIAEGYDGYGSVTINDPAVGTFHILNDYGIESKYPMEIAALCVVGADWMLESARVVYDLDAQKCVIKDYRRGPFPEPLRKYGIGDFTGKRAFYFSDDETAITLRVSQEQLDELPEGHDATDEFNKGRWAFIFTEPAELESYG